MIWKTIFVSPSKTGVWAASILNSRLSSVFTALAKLFHAAASASLVIALLPAITDIGVGSPDTVSFRAGSGFSTTDGLGSECSTIASLMDMDGITGRGAILWAAVDATGCVWLGAAETKGSDFFFDPDFR